MENLSLGIIGVGKVGSTLLEIMNKKGFSIKYAVSSSKRKRNLLKERGVEKVFPQIEYNLPPTDLLLLTTPDDAIKEAATELVSKESVYSGTVVVHTSGSQSSKEISVVKKRGAYIASLHPLKSFTGKKVSSDFLAGVFFAVEGDAEALPVLKEVVLSLGGNPFIIKTEQKELYHAAAVAASNYLVALNHYAVKLLKEAGVQEDKALQFLEPLVRGTMENIFRDGPLKSLTGPIERNDQKTIQRHMESIKRIGNLEKKIYSILGLYTIEMAAEKNNITAEKYAGIRSFLEEETK